jgi:hypothetical protein
MIISAAPSLHDRETIGTFYAAAAGQLAHSSGDDMNSCRSARLNLVGLHAPWRIACGISRRKRLPRLKNATKLPV